MARKVIDLARGVDDFIIDRLLQPGVNHADWHLGLSAYALARACVGLGAGLGLIWVHRFDALLSSDFFQDMLCVIIMASIALRQIGAHESSAPHRPALAPAVRATGLFWRTLWLAVLMSFPTQVPVEGMGQLSSNFAWTLLLVLPYWLICCRRPPAPPRRVAGVLRLAPISARRAPG